MSDPTPLSDPVEGRLRATLRAEADRHPVTPDIEALRARGDRTIVDLDLSPRRNRARLLAVAAVVALLAGALGALALRAADEDDGEPVIADEPPATGYYLPGAGWEVQEVIGLPVPQFPGAERVVEYGEAWSAEDVPPGPDLGTASIMVFRTEDEDPDLVALAESAGLTDAQRVTRGEGDDTREYVVSPLAGLSDEAGEQEIVDPASIEADGGSLAAFVAGRVLAVDWYGPIGREAVLDLADRWWTSGGEAVALDPAVGLTRISDVTFRDVEPVATTELVTFGGLDDVDDPAELYGDASIQVLVQVESPEGWTGAYTLVAPGDAVTTGFQDAEAGVAAGLAPEEAGAPLPADVGGPAPAWESSGGIVADVPAASLGIARTSYLGDPLTAEQARELWAALAPVDHDAWVAAGPDETDGYGLPDDIWGETLAATDVARWFDAVESGRQDSASSSDSGSSSGSDVTDTVEPYEPIEVTPRDGTNPAAGRPPEEVDRLVADALLALVGGPGPVDADLFAPVTTFGDHDGGGTEVSLAVEEVAAGAEEALVATEGPIPGAWNVLWSVAPAAMTRLVGEVEGCPPLAELAADPAVVVLQQDVTVDDQAPCADWSALIVRLDDQQRIVSVASRFGP